jgi:Na+/H+-dicarboxylate symporter
MMRRLPLILIALLTAVLLLNAWIPLPVKEALYALSLTIKSVIIFILPAIIFSLLFKTIIGLANRATTILALILICLSFSNFIATWAGHFVGDWIYHLDLGTISPQVVKAGLAPAWQWEMPTLIENNKAMLLAIVLGMVLGKLKLHRTDWFMGQLDHLTTRLLKGITYLIPFFVLGFFIKLQSDGVMQMILKDYLGIFIAIIFAQLGYLFLVYVVVSRFNIREACLNIKNMLPAAIAGFSTMSSAAVLPLTMNGVAERAINKDIARSAVSVTTNIHLLGDCVAIPILAYALMKSFGVPEPSLWTYALFVMYFVIAKFSVAAVPAGGMIIMLPVLEHHLGFTADMLSLIFALYVMLDPVTTCMNVLGNGALAKGIDRLVAWRYRKAPVALQGAQAQ